MSTHNGIITIIFQRKGAISIVRNSFIQMSKLTNLKGRINYISSHARQENLYAVYETTDRKFWTELAKCNQEEFKKSGTEGKCIEARELIIALPESFVDYEPDRLLKLLWNTSNKITVWSVSLLCTITNARPIIISILSFRSESCLMSRWRRLPQGICFMMKTESMYEPKRDTGSSRTASVWL